MNDCHERLCVHKSIIALSSKFRYRFYTLNSV
jgi:hypothetical protein